MACEVEFTDEFEAWWGTLDEDEQDAVARVVRLLEEKGLTLSHPYSSGVEGSTFSHMRELRIQHRGRPYRVLYAFDSRRIALLLIGVDKTGQDRWYEQIIPVADRIYQEHLKAISKEVDNG